uniref:Uncharacterized protein n=1 Tax=Desertifilum tharense IPPAS B-1220 TaxID=1781255 RepID=A0ACD5GVZ1_9CYAN
MAQIHWQSTLGCTTLCFMLASAFSLPVASAFPIAQATPGAITEQVGFINTCRGSGSTGLTLYEDAALTRASGTIQPNTVVTLTGLVAPGIAQIKSPDVGWVRARDFKH